MNIAFAILILVNIAIVVALCKLAQKIDTLDAVMMYQDDRISKLCKENEEDVCAYYKKDSKEK